MEIFQGKTITSSFSTLSPTITTNLTSFPQSEITTKVQSQSSSKSVNPTLSIFTTTQTSPIYAYPTPIVATKLKQTGSSNFTPTTLSIIKPVLELAPSPEISEKPPTVIELLKYPRVFPLEYSWIKEN